MFYRYLDGLEEMWKMYEFLFDSYVELMIESVCR